MIQRLLTESEYLSCFGEPMRDVTQTAVPVLDIEPYLGQIDLDGLEIEHLNQVHYVYRNPTEQFDHVLIGTSRFNTLLVIIVDRYLKQIIGHWPLDLNQKYGVAGQHLRAVP